MLIWPKLLAMGIGLAFAVLALIFLVLIFRQTKPNNESPKILNLIDLLSAMNATPLSYRINPKQDTGITDSSTKGNYRCHTRAKRSRRKHRGNG